MAGMTRRSAIKAGAAAALAAAVDAPAVAAARAPEVVVVGAGVFGACTARALQRAGRRVLLLDAWAPAHARASSGGESRLTRGSYGADEVYTRMAWDSLAEWRALSARAELPLFHRAGVLFFFPTAEDYVHRTIEVHRRLRLPTAAARPRARCAAAFPMIDFDGVELGLWEPEFGALMARRAVQTMVAEFVAAGGEYRQRRRPAAASGRRAAAAHQACRAARNCPPPGSSSPAARGCPSCSRDLLGQPHLPDPPGGLLLRAPRPATTASRPAGCPAGPISTPATSSTASPTSKAAASRSPTTGTARRSTPTPATAPPPPPRSPRSRAYMERRFPGLRGAPLSEARVCQYENSANGDLLIDFHPRRPNVFLVGAGSGHGFKHGPAVGAYAAELRDGHARRARAPLLARLQGRAAGPGGALKERMMEQPIDTFRSSTWGWLRGTLAGWGTIALVPVGILLTAPGEWGRWPLS